VLLGQGDESSAAGVGRRELWAGLLLLGFVVLLLEWWVAYRSGRRRLAGVGKSLR
jgi:hypothetical protein